MPRAEVSMLQPDDLLSASEACRALQITPPVLRAWVKSGKLKPFKTIEEGMFLFLRRDLPGPGATPSAATEPEPAPAAQEPPAEPTAFYLERQVGRILIMSKDEPTIKQVGEMKKENHAVTVLKRAADLPDALKSEPPDLIIVDIDCGPETGWKLFASVLAQIKRCPNPRLPVFIVSGVHTSPDDAAKAMRLGAWDMIRKPFASSVLAARIHRVLSRNLWEQLESAASADVVASTDGCVILDAGLKTLRTLNPVLKTPAAIVRLTAKETHLLLLFLKRPGRLFPKRLLMETVWGYSSDIHSRTLDAHIRNLRLKLGPYRDRIETLYGLGYRFRDVRA